MTAPPVIALDFETDSIESRPAYPPTPVGFSIQAPWETEPTYWAWGHPCENNCTKDEAVAVLHAAWDSGLPFVFHHAKFDLAVACEKLGLPMLPWQRIHDTTFLLFLCDPHAREHGLKPAAAVHLGMPPDEQDELADWIFSHRKQLIATYGGNITKAKHGATSTGAWISKAPGGLVGKYANGDIKRTLGLFNYLYPVTVENGMEQAYSRERRVLPIFMENERDGMRVDMGALADECVSRKADLERVEHWLRAKLQASGLNFDADRDVSAILLSRGIVPEENWTLTAGGENVAPQLSMAKDALLPEHFTGPGGAHIASALGYRNRLTTCLSMFMEPWLAQASINNGHISTNWNQTRGEGGGTRTGRPSTNKHNFLNISKDFEGRSDGYVHPAFLDLPPLPLVRKFVLPDEDGVFLHRDFDGQELRVFAHFEQGALMQQYLANPKLDPHAFIGKELMAVAQREFERTAVKVLNFQSLYGGGVPALVAALRCTTAEAKEFKAFHDQALPGRKILNEVIKAVVGRGDPIRTWGGRLYFPEDKRVVNGRLRDFVYKLINYLIQGSAADYTKECLIDWHSHPGRSKSSRFLVTVYDEIDLTSSTEDYISDMAILKEVMEEKRLDVPMLSSPKWGPSWGDLKKGEPT